MKDGEIISNIFANVSESHCNKTENIIKLLEEDNDNIEGSLSEFIGVVSLAEMNKILVIKGFKK